MHHQKYYKLVGKDLSWQTNTNIPPQINSKGRLEENNEVTTFIFGEKQTKTILYFFQDSSNITE